MDEPDLSEILGITPFLQLVPTQDLAPLVSVSRVQPQALEPQNYLPPRSEELLEYVAERNEAGCEDTQGLLQRLGAKFRAFDVPELDQITFKRPIIAGDSETLPELPPFLRLYDGLYDKSVLVDENALVELGDTLDMTPMTDDQLHLLHGSETKLEAEEHMRYYKEKFERLLSLETSGKKRRLPNDRGLPKVSRRRISLDRSKLCGSRLSALYVFLDVLAADSENESIEALPESTKFIVKSDKHGSVLTPLGLRQLGLLILEIAGSLSVAECDVEYLKEVQSLCQSTIRHYSNFSGKVQTSSIRISAEASSLLLTILNSTLQHRELHLQSYLDCIVEFLCQSLLKLGLLKPTDTVFDDVVECLDKLTVQLQTNTANDQTLTRIEYMCIQAIFAEVKADTTNHMRDAMVRVLSQIFRGYAPQRHFIINEILSNIGKLSTSKGLPRDIQLVNGSKILFFAALLVDLIQSFDPARLKKEAEAYSGLPKSDNPNSPSSVKLGLLLSEAAAIMDEAKSIADQVAEFFLGRVSPGDTIHKSIFLGLMDDLVAMMAIPEWPGAETLISVFVQKLVSAVKGQKMAPSEEPFILEVLGKFGLGYIELDFPSENQVFESGLSSTLFEKLSELHRIVLGHLQEQGTRTPHIKASFRFQLLKTIVNYKSFFDRSRMDQNGGTQFAVISSKANHLPEESMRIAQAIDLAFSLLIHDHKRLPLERDVTPGKTYKLLLFATAFDSLYSCFLDLLTSCLESPKVKVAAKAVRVLTPLVTRDPKILLHERINSSISKVLSTGAVLSKDAVIDLMGQYMFSSNTHLDKYYVLIGNRSSDDGILIRKRVLKIMRGVFEYSSDIEVKSFALSRIFERLDDEEPSIVEMVKLTLHSLVFETKKPKEVTEVMIYLIGSNRETRKLQMAFLRLELRATDVKSNTFIKLKTIFDIAFEKISDLIEISDTADVEKTFGFVAALAECDSRLVNQDQLISLQPFLVDEVFDREIMCLSTLRILKLAVSNMKVLRSAYITKTNLILLKRITKFQIKELHEAVQILEVFSKALKSDALAKAAVSSMKMLWPFVSSRSTTIPATETPKIRKVLHLLGCFASYCDLESLRAMIRSSNVGLKEKETVISLITRFLLFFCLNDIETVTKATAIKNLLNVASCHPKLFLSDTILHVLDNEIMGSSPKIRLEIIKGLTLFLTKEDEKISRRNEQSETLVKSLDADRNMFLNENASNIADGVCSSVTQRYIDEILHICLQDASDLGEAAVLFLQVVMKLGYVNPKRCISTIIALEASPMKVIKRIAIDLHAQIFNRHESLADRSYGEAIRLACEYSKRTSANGHLRAFLFLRSVYRVVNKTYLAKKKFIYAVIRLLNVNLNSQDLAEAISRRDIAVFLALNLLVLDFTSREEVYLLLFHLDRFITGEGIDLAERITATIKSADGEGMSLDNLQLLFVFLQTALAFICLRQTIAASFSIRSGMMDGFHPGKPDMNLRQPPKLVAFVDYPLDDLALQTKLSEPALFGRLFTRIVQSTKGYTG